jgi:Zinc-ribbon containing domain
MSKETNTKSAKFEGASYGCLAGSAMYGCLAFIGIILTLTGIGAIIGIPLIIIGILMFFIGPLLGLGTLKGECPWCGNLVTVMGKGQDCPICKKRIVVKDKKFIKIE